METVKANELRLGNWLRNPHTNEDKQATVETVSDIQNGFMQRIGIPLTEDILVRLGFEEQMFGTIKTDAYKKGIITVHLISGNTGECQIALYNKLLPIFYNYVHELQNLAYDLRQELTLNP